MQQQELSMPELPSQPFTPVVHISRDAEIKTTWGVIEDYRAEIAKLHAKIADLIVERDALTQRRIPPRCTLSNAGMAKVSK